MAANYYLMNGKNEKASAINLLVGDKIVRNFDDISGLDLETMKISRKDSIQYLREFNPKIDLSGDFYDASFPHNRTQVKTYPAIFDFESDKTKKCQDVLREYAEKRKYNKDHGLSVKLDWDSKLYEYTRTILYNILDDPHAYLTGYGSNISSKLKDIMKARYHSNASTGRYLDSNSNMIRSLLSNYTELRNLTIEYMLLISKEDTNIRMGLEKKTLWENEYMEPMEPIVYERNKEVIIPKYKQLTIFDCFESLK